MNLYFFLKLVGIYCKPNAITNVIHFGKTHDAYIAYSTEFPDLIAEFKELSPDVVESISKFRKQVIWPKIVKISEENGISFQDHFAAEFYKDENIIATAFKTANSPHKSEELDGASNTVGSGPAALDRSPYKDENIIAAAFKTANSPHKSEELDGASNTVGSGAAALDRSPYGPASKPCNDFRDDKLDGKNHHSALTAIRDPSSSPARQSLCNEMYSSKNKSVLPTNHLGRSEMQPSCFKQCTSELPSGLDGDNTIQKKDVILSPNRPLIKFLLKIIRNQVCKCHSSATNDFLLNDVQVLHNFTELLLKSVQYRNS